MLTNSILFTGSFRFPDKDAAAFRVNSIADLFRPHFNSVIFAGWEKRPYGKEYYIHNNDLCFPQDELRASHSSIAIRLIAFLFRGLKTTRWILGNRKYFNMIVLYNPPFIFTISVVLICRIYSIKLVIDSTEWYQGAHLPGGKYGIASVENWLRMEIAYKLVKNIICISTYLQYQFRNLNTIVLPPLLPGKPDLVFSRPPISSQINLVYAGEPGLKDSLKDLVASLQDVRNRLGVDIKLHLVGLNKDDKMGLSLTSLIPEHNPDDMLIFYGRISRIEVFRLYKMCHFSILLRDRMRYALAGFPTKAMESLFCGCPIISNAIGDLRLVLSHATNGFVIDRENLSYHLYSCLARVIQEESIDKMSQAAVDSSLIHFSPSRYRKSFYDFYNQC